MTNERARANDDLLAEKRQLNWHQAHTCLETSLIEIQAAHHIFMVLLDEMAGEVSCVLGVNYSALRMVEERIGELVAQGLSADPSMT